MTNVKLPRYARKLFLPFRYKVLHGGRGSGKSTTVARSLLLLSAQEKQKVLCGREFQNSINDSVHSLLASQIEEMKLESFFDIKRDSIEGRNGSEFLFKGIKHNIESIKSIPNIKILWLEEADRVSQKSWDTLIPTIRENGSEIWCTYNPSDENDPTHKKFVNTDNPPEDSFIIRVNWNMNPWFPEVLRKEMEYMYATDPDLALHVWEGECRKNSHAQIFKNKWKVEHFEVQSYFDGPYYGVDWGFSNDPTCIIKFYIDLKNKKLFIQKEAFGFKTDLPQIPGLFDRIPEARRGVLRADCSRPETISYIKGRGFNIIPAKKWTGSVEDGIEWLRSFIEIIIHPNCRHMLDEAKNYCYKVDRLTGDVLTDVVDKHNHGWDAIRYGAEPMITKNISLFDHL